MGVWVCGGWGVGGGGGGWGVGCVCGGGGGGGGGWGGRVTDTEVCAFATLAVKQTA